MDAFTEAYYVGLMMWRSFFPKSRFSTDEIPDLSGRVAIVTGGNTGIGREIVKGLLTHNAKVYMASRNKVKADAAIRRLAEETGKDPIFLELDLSDLSSVRQAANEFVSKESELHLLFNNAGLMGPPVDQLTAESYDLTFGTSVIGHFLFTELLMPALCSGAGSDHHARVITTSSSMALVGKIELDTIRDGPTRRKMSSEAMYSQTKLANAIVAREIARRYADRGIVSIAVDPGSIETSIQQYYLEAGGLNALVARFMKWITARPSPFGALTPLWAALAPEAEAANGKYAIPVGRIAQCRPEMYDNELGNRLWTFLQMAVAQ
ncbi:hypothetical protein C8Q72DRAFT_881274 [Fomitopsis betulina]|nr:hypothetical protein C8Q72DRAFT_881274 [Fomitopsis betulina]